jgi:xylulokinase
LRVLPGDGAEQAPDDWWRALVAATRRLLARHVGPASDVAVCCSTQGESTVPVDRSGKALANCILWMDVRGAPHPRRQFRGPANLQGVSLLCVRRWIRLTGGMPSPTGKDPAAHMLFVRDELPEIYERTHKFLNVLDYLNLRLTGRMVATYDSILKSWVTDNRDADDVKYDAGLVEDCGIDADKLPEIVKCTEALGRLTPAVAEELGLAPETQVVAGAIDNTAAAIGAGTVDDYAVHLNVGTSSWVCAHVPFKKTDVFAVSRRSPVPSPAAGCSRRCRPQRAATSPFCATTSSTTRTSSSQRRGSRTSSRSSTRSRGAFRPAATACSTRRGSGESAPRSRTMPCAPASTISR